MAVSYYLSVSYIHPDGYCPQLDQEIDTQAAVERTSSGMGFGAWADGGRDLQYKYASEHQAQAASERIAGVAHEWRDIATVTVEGIDPYEAAR